MHDEHSPVRAWRVIAPELSLETNGKKIRELAHELSRALLEQEGIAETYSSKPS